MKIADLTQKQLHKKIKSGDFRISIGPFNIDLQSPFKQVSHGIALLYPDYTMPGDCEFIDFKIEISPPNNYRRWIKPQANFNFFELKPFKPLPANQTFALFEWGLNWCIASNAHNYSIIHSAVVAKNDVAIIMPGTPGSGKSTLCAAMMLKGWRLLSDEMALLSNNSLKLTPVPRPVSLKNESIDIISRRQRDLIFGPLAHDTSKGTVTHIRASAESIIHADKNATPRLLILPKYKKNAQTTLIKLSKPRAFMELMENTFNYHILGKQSGELINKLLEQIHCYQFSYSDLDDAIDRLEALLMEQA